MTEEARKQTALIIGASRGLGLAMAGELLGRGWHVVGTQRRTGGEGLRALSEQHAGLVEVLECDITEASDIAAVGQALKRRRIDLLFINAGISNGRGERLCDISHADFVRIMTTNAFAPMRAIEALEGLVPEGGTIGVMSSGLGSVANNTNGGWESYRASKAALNTLMRSYAARRPDDKRAMLLIAPGWVRTDMGGPSATLGINESVPLVVDTLLANAGKPGLRFVDRFGEPVPW